MFVEMEQEEGYPATVKIVQEDSSLVLYISLKATWGTFASPNLCGFYEEFERNVRQASGRPPAKQVTPSSQKPSKEIIESSLPPPSTQRTSSSPPPRGKIVWVYVNLREGPGTRYKIIGKAHMNNSFEILAENPSWLRVRLENRAEGWVFKKAASESPVTHPPQSLPASSHNTSKAGAPSKPPGPM